MFRHIAMTCRVLNRRMILLPFILLFVVPCGTYLIYDEDVDILLEFSFMFI